MNYLFSPIFQTFNKYFVCSTGEKTIFGNRLWGLEESRKIQKTDNWRGITQSGTNTEWYGNKINLNQDYINSFIYPRPAEIMQWQTIIICLSVS